MGLNRKDYSGAREPFEYMTRLLLGLHSINNAVLVSCRSWSIYTNIITLPDPTDVSAPLICVTRGVPSRAGERKQFVVDGTAPRNFSLTNAQHNALDTASTARLVCEFDVSKPFWFVGTSSVAFEVIVKIELEPYHRPAGQFGKGSCRTMFKVGLLELEALALQSKKMAPCYHAESAIGSKFAVLSGCKVFSSTLDFNKEASTDTIFMSLSARSISARWFCLLFSEEQRRTSRIYRKAEGLMLWRTFIRDRNSCPTCCIKAVDISQAGVTNDANQADIAIIIL